MPILVLFISLFGNYLIFQKTGSDLSTSYEVEELSVLPFSENNNYFVNGSKSIDSFYFSTYLSVDEVLVKILDSNLTFVDYSSVIPGLYFSSLGLLEVSSNNIIYSIPFGILRLGDVYSIGFLDMTYTFSSNGMFLYWFSEDLSFMGFDFVQGWIFDYTDFNYNILNDFGVSSANFIGSLNTDYYINFYPIFTPLISADYILLNNTSNFVFTQVIKDEVFYMSFFDVSLYNTDVTFKKFQLPFLRNVFESVFNILEFENSYVSSFVLTSFTWMIQLLLLHVVVDTLAFIFKMYHKLMDKVVQFYD